MCGIGCFALEIGIVLLGFSAAASGAAAQGRGRAATIARAARMRLVPEAPARTSPRARRKDDDAAASSTIVATNLDDTK